MIDNSEMPLPAKLKYAYLFFLVNDNVASHNVTVMYHRSNHAELASAYKEFTLSNPAYANYTAVNMINTTNSLTSEDLNSVDILSEDKKLTESVFIYEEAALYCKQLDNVEEPCIYYINEATYTEMFSNIEVAKEVFKPYTSLLFDPPANNITKLMYIPELHQNVIETLKGK